MLVNTYVNRGLTLVKGEGAFLFDQQEKRYLDLMSNYGVNIFGYNHPTITRALTQQVEKLITLHGSFSHDVRNEATKALLQTCDQPDSQVYWSNSGAEAIEAALKFAVVATQKKRFIVCDHGYHGKTLGALSATAGEKYKHPFSPLLWEFVQIPYNDLPALESALNDETAAFIVEPIQGEGGIYVPSAGYLEGAQELCSQKNILLIIDEIQSGVGRTGRFLASQKEQVTPDLLCLGKGLAGGIPVGATMVSAKIGASIPKHIHTSTFGGNPLACAGTRATLNLLDTERFSHIQQVGLYFMDQLQQITSPLIQGVRGEGLMIGIVVPKEKRNPLMKRLQDRQVLVIPAGEDVIRFLPPYIIEKPNIDFAVQALQSSLQELAS